MANNEEIFTEEDTFEEISSPYELDATEYDENDEENVEYLDLDLEVDSIQESSEEYIPEVPAPITKPQVIQSSVLKTSYLNAAKPKRKQKQKPMRAKKNAIGRMPSIVRTRPSTENIAYLNCTSHAGNSKIDSLESATVHAAVNAINAKLADSAHSMNGLGRNIVSNERLQSQPGFHAASSEEWGPFQTIKNDLKSEDDGLDLFFQSMAQTVLHLPSRVQAKIKMDICKVIAMAEMKYCSSDTASDANKF